MPAPTFRSASSGATTTTTVTAPKPAGCTTGDLLVAVCQSTGVGSRTWNTPTGWTQLASSGASGTCWAVFTRTADGTEGASFSFALSGSMDSSKAVVACINGSTGTLTVDANAQATTATSGTSFTAPSVTTSGANRLVLRFFPMVGEFSSRTWTPPTSHTEQLDADSCEIASIIQASSGATGTGVATSSGPGAAVTAVTVAVAGPSGAFFTTSYAVVGTPVLAKLNIGVVTRKVTAATVLGRVQAPAITRRVVVNAIVSRLVPGQLFQKTWTAVVTPIVTAIRSLLPSAPVPGLMTLNDAAVTRSRMSDLAVTTMTLADTPVE